MATELQHDDLKAGGSAENSAGSSALPSAQKESRGDAGQPSPSLDDFLGVPTRSLEDWAHLWSSDLAFPIQHSGSLKGRAFGLLKKLLRPFLKAALGDLWDRQRVFNLIALETLIGQRELYKAKLAEQDALLHVLDVRTTQGFQEVMRHNDALFARVDQKLDRYRRESKELWHRLGALIAVQESSGHASRPLAETLEEQGYLELEKKFRGSERDIADRVRAYAPYLEGRQDALDLGCGRGEALRVFAEKGIDARGVDASSEMVARCKEQGLKAEQGDLFEALGRQPECSVDLIVSFHVIEHLPTAAVDRLVRLAWRALRPGGLLILETPSPLALAMSARDFWLDPTHRRPVHPGHLEVTFREAGFEPVHRVDLHPYPEEAHLPEIDLELVASEQRALADQVNRLRDMLDDLLFGDRDFGLLGHKPR